MSHLPHVWSKCSLLCTVPYPREEGSSYILNWPLLFWEGNWKGWHKYKNWPISSSKPGHSAPELEQPAQWTFGSCGLPRTYACILCPGYPNGGLSASFSSMRQKVSTSWQHHSWTKSPCKTSGVHEQAKGTAVDRGTKRCREEGLPYAFRTEATSEPHSDHLCSRASPSFKNWRWFCWRDNLAVKNISCYGRGPEFGPIHPHQVAHNCLNSSAKDQMVFCHFCHTHTDTHTVHMYT